MIYFTTFILALFFTHIARALPQGCNDPTPDLYDNGQYNLPIPAPPLHATHDKTYDDPHGLTKNTPCSNLAKRYPRFGDFPHYPYIGDAYDISRNSPNCGECWKLTNKKNVSISFIALGYSSRGFSLSETAYKKLGGGKAGKDGVEVEGRKVSHTVCGI
jgi:hypothetical protein